MGGKKGSCPCRKRVALPVQELGEERTGLWSGTAEKPARPHGRERSQRAVRGPDGGGLPPDCRVGNRFPSWVIALYLHKKGRKGGNCLYSNTVFYQENSSGVGCVSVCIFVQGCVCMCVCAYGEDMSVCLWYVYVQKMKNIEKTIKFSLSTANSFPGTNAPEKVCCFRLKMLNARVHGALGLLVSSVVVRGSGPSEGGLQTGKFNILCLQFLCLAELFFLTFPLCPLLLEVHPGIQKKETRKRAKTPSRVLYGSHGAWRPRAQWTPMTWWERSGKC